MDTTPASKLLPEPTPKTNHFRFHQPHLHLAPVFGQDWFALKAEAFARFFGTPFFLITQTLIVAIWIGLNVLGYSHFDLYPFILLNLAFSLQAAYAAPLILLAQTRQADRDKAHADADALHREALAKSSEDQLIMLTKQTSLLVELINQNTHLTEVTHNLTQRVEVLTSELHSRICQEKAAAQSA